MATRRPSAVGANGDVDQRAGGGAAAALQHLLAREHELDRAAALLRQPHGDGLAVDGDLAAEAAADLERHDLELRLRQPEHARDHQLGRELALRGGPHGGKAVGIDLRDHDLRLEIALMARCRPVTLIRAVAGASASARAASPRAITVREQTLLGARGRGSTPLVKTCSCSTGASGAMAAAMSSTAASGS